MIRIRDGLMWLFVIFMGLILQVAFAFTDLKSTPRNTVLNFSKAYFLFDDAMEDYLCNNYSQVNNKNNVDNYLMHVSEEAIKLGFDINSIRRTLTHIKTESVINENCNCAKVRLTASSKTHINPLFTWIANFFNLGQVYNIDKIFELVKENGTWKICKFPCNTYFEF